MQKDVKKASAEQSRSMPQLRFEEYSKDWKTLKLKKITSYVDYRGRAPKKSESGHFLVTAKNIKQGFIDYECSKEYVAEEDYLNVMSKGIPIKGDILFTTEAPMGNVAQVDNPNIALAQRVIKFRGNENLKNSFLLYYMLSKPFKKYTLKKAIGSTVKGISGKELHKTPISFPSLEEQQKIASFLSSVDTKLNLLQQKKDRLEQYKKGVMQQIFSQQLRFQPDTSTPLSAGDGNSFTDWEEKRLGDISDVRDGTHDSPKYVDTGYVLITSKNLLKNGEIDFDNVNYISQEDYIKINKRSNVSKGDILFGMIGTIGNPVLVKSDNFAIKNVALIKQKEILKNSFFIHYLKSSLIEKQFHRENAGGTQKFIALGLIRKLSIKVPSLEEQTKIATFLSAIDKKIALVATQIENTKQFKKGLLQQMFV